MEDRRVHVAFPTGLCLAALILDGLGLTLAALGVQWGAQTPSVEYLRGAWVYVHLAIGAGWFLLWPAVALRGAGRGGEGGPGELGWQMTALLVGAVPAVGVGAWLAEVGWEQAVQVLLLQGAFGLFALGVLSWRGATGGATWILAGLLAALYVGLPGVAYLWGEFLPALGATGWWGVAPALAIVRSCAPGEGAASFLWWTVLAYAVAGGVAMVVPRRNTAR